MKPDAGKEETAVIGKVPVPWKCGGSSSSNKWGGTQHRGAFSTCFTTAVMWEGPGEGLLL